MTRRDSFGPSRVEPATPGSYGLAPRGHRLPAGTRLGEVRLRVADLTRSLAFYGTVLGLRTVARAGSHVVLAAQGDDRVLVELREVRGARPAGRRARLGLFHFALLVPDRPALGRFVRHLEAIGVHPGAGDHEVSEALYLQDPDGLGIEVYADRPRDRWRRTGRELVMGTDPVDLEGLRQAAGDAPWTGMPAGTVMGHVHLHVGDLAASAAFFGDALGFDRTVWSYPGALFLAADGYHHHVGTNLWAGPAARPTADDEAGLIAWTLEVPDAASVDATATSLASAGHPLTREDGDAITSDPWGTGTRIRAAGRDLARPRPT